MKKEGEDSLVETLFNYAIFFAVILFIAIATTIVRRSRILSGLFNMLGKTFLFLLMFFMLLMLTAIISMLAGLIILIHPYLYGKSQFFTNGEPLHFLAVDNMALLQFSLTYGVLYIMFFLICRKVFAKTGVPAAFAKVSIRIRQIFRFYSRDNQFERKVIGTATHLTASTILLLIYPIVLTLFFPNLEMTFIGNLTLYIVLLIFSIVPVPGDEGLRRYRRYSRVG